MTLLSLTLDTCPRHFTSFRPQQILNYSHSIGSQAVCCRSIRGESGPFWRRASSLSITAVYRLARKRTTRHTWVHGVHWPKPMLLFHSHHEIWSVYDFLITKYSVFCDKWKTTNQKCNLRDSAIPGLVSNPQVGHCYCWETFVCIYSTYIDTHACACTHMHTHRWCAKVIVKTYSPTALLQELLIQGCEYRL